MFLGSTGPHGELFVFLIKKEPIVLTKAVEFRLCVAAETLKACALIGLHMIAEEATSSSLKGTSPVLGGRWRCGHPWNPLWKASACPLTRSTLRMACLLPRRKVATMWRISCCSFAQHACSPLLQESLREVMLCKVVLTCHFFVGHVVPLSEVSGALLEFFFLTVVSLSTVAVFAERSPIEEGLQQYGDGCDGETSTGIEKVQTS